MFITIKNTKIANIDALRTNLLLNARFNITSYPMKATEIILDEYLRTKKYGSLKQCCLALLNTGKFLKSNNDIIFVFKNDTLDHLATLISFGNSEVYGSKILFEAFDKRLF